MAQTGYGDGYEQGKKQAQDGKDRDTRPGGLGSFAKSVASDSYRENFAEGVRDGYRDEKVRENKK